MEVQKSFPIEGSLPGGECRKLKHGGLCEKAEAPAELPRAPVLDPKEPMTQVGYVGVASYPNKDGEVSCFTLGLEEMRYTWVLFN